MNSDRVYTLPSIIETEITGDADYTYEFFATKDVSSWDLVNDNLPYFYLIQDDRVTATLIVQAGITSS